MRSKHWIVGLLLVLQAALASAELTIEITQGVDNPTPIAVVPFRWQGTDSLPEDVAAIVASDLHRSGQFQPLSTGEMLSLPSTEEEVFYRDWRALKTDYLLIGRVLPSAASGLSVQYELFDVYTQKSLLSGIEHGHRQTMRDMAHKVSNAVYEKLTGIRGAFNTKLLYVSANRIREGEFVYRLLLSDIDGARERVVREQREPMLTPVWAPDGERIAYVSFEANRRPAIFLQNLRTGERRQLTNFSGLNGAPSFSPDGRQLAMVLSKDGSPDIYVMDLASGQLNRVTTHFAIDTEPDWMPDGKSLVFTSDRGGRPQIYKVTLATGHVERLTFDGSYNARARVLADGSGMVLVNRKHGEFNIALYNFRRGATEVLTQTTLDESPSVAPNGTMLIYATMHNGKGILAAVSVDGGVKYRLPSKFGDVREPAWSPYLN